MRQRCSLYVDVGYLLTSAAVRVTGTSLRNGIHVDYEPLIAELVRQAETTSGLSVLRVHWYDSAKDGVPDPRQQRIGELPRVKLRLGRFGLDGQQKGVDLRIGLDLVTHARNGAADVFILVSGDDDLTEAVEEAQVHGVQLLLLAVPNSDNKPHGISRHLIRAADGLEILNPAAIDRTVMKVETPPPPPVVPKPAVVPSPPRVTPKDLAGLGRPGPPDAPRPPAAVIAYSSATGSAPQVGAEYDDPAELAEQIDSVVVNVLTAFRKSASAEALAELEAGQPSIPRDIDKALLTDLSDHRGEYELSERVRHLLRAQFWNRYDEARSRRG
ncbi:NYN domain-containing protein [Actinoplanes sp. TRM 88003]|uniref:NYN domain-containing protein n=1 Tax=Paractinoplanes aksuensis TaxID=2939490 RepID=A0ABT1DLD4_9ACTN|nr:NYN domain-containing protein [Actinoplanes aksuensis]MCO8271619.1 NYN domain-containing protein [Actinoplanes aksuensis]